MITLHGWQIRAGRVALGWTQRKLAKRAHIGVGTIKRLEKMHGPVQGQHSTITSLCVTFEQHGVELLDQDSPGVRLRSDHLKFPQRKSA